MAKPELPIDIEAEIYFFTTEEGGRMNPVLSGYRPQFHYDGYDWDAIQNYVGVVEPVQLGQTVTAHLYFLSPQYHVGKLYPGKEFLIREGSKVVGRGRVTKVFDLEKSAKEAVKRDARGRGSTHDAT
jgi:translation elongation factor EF-Tu-like GTPase